MPQSTHIHHISHLSYFIILFIFHHIHIRRFRIPHTHCIPYYIPAPRPSYIFNHIFNHIFKL